MMDTTDKQQIASNLTRALHEAAPTLARSARSLGMLALADASARLGASPPSHRQVRDYLCLFGRDLAALACRSPEAAEALSQVQACLARDLAPTS
jgi:hypothetical protein